MEDKAYDQEDPCADSMVDAILQEIHADDRLISYKTTCNAIENQSPAVIIDPLNLNIILEEIRDTCKHKMHLF